VKGVYKRGKRLYEAHIMANGKRYYFGRFVRKSDAARAVTTARKALHKTFARAG
jgi:transposase InsO family protein